MGASKRELKPKWRSRPAPLPTPAAAPPVTDPVLASVLEEARRAGLLDGDKSEHVSFRAPPALVAAAKREAGVSSTSEATDRETLHAPIHIAPQLNKFVERDRVLAGHRAYNFGLDAAPPR